MKTLIIAAATLLMAGSATSALAANKTKADLNGDGRVSAQEHQQKKVAKLMRFDRDGDGRISRTEYQAMMDRKANRHGGKSGKPMKNKFAKLDRDGDGFITSAEISERAARKFARMDKSPRYDAARPAPAAPSPR